MTLPPLPVVCDVLRTPQSRFADLPDFAFVPHFVEVGALRIAYIDEGPRDAPVVLLMHGEPTWSFLYRKMIPPLLQAGLRVVAPDLVGFGRSDKPARRQDHSYGNQVAWMDAWLQALDLQHITLFCQDWGSLIGLRMVVDAPQRFARIVLANGGLPTGTTATPRAFHVWRAFARWSPWFPIGRIVAFGCAHALLPRERAAYDAPFPTRRHHIAARLMPGFVPTSAQDPQSRNNLQAWEFFAHSEKPFLTLFSSRDPVTRGGHKVWQKRVPGAQGQPHMIIRGAGHFLQEDKGAELAQAIVAFMEADPATSGTMAP
ncbi:MAG: haloalkane dehalogenase [Betaproteobacteria bacterium]